MSTILRRPITHPADESGGRKNSRLKIKAPFGLTSMSQGDKYALIWVWSLRGKQWTVDQELRFDGVSKRDESRS